jgi:NAD(P)H dehydrogenase (quinone)
MKVLIVFAHPEPKSFNGDLKDLAVQTLKDNGHEVEVSDLYAMRFKAAMDQDDFLHRKNIESFNPVIEMLNASETNSFAQDIENEMNKIKWADLLIFQFPIWWNTFPAIMKGWIERVFAFGFAHNILEGKVYDKGLLKGKKTMLSFTLGATKDIVFKDDPSNDTTKLLPDITNGILRFVGLEVIPPFVVFGAIDMTKEEKEKQLQNYKQKLMAL